VDSRFVSKNVAITVLYFTIKLVDEIITKLGKFYKCFLISDKFSQTSVYFVVVDKCIHGLKKEHCSQHDVTMHFHIKRIIFPILIE
jgi:hypothetical protein